MSHHHHATSLVITDLTTGITADFNAMGMETREFRMQFANAAAFKSVEDHRRALHHEASIQALTLHHNHPDFLPMDMHETEHEGQPAYVMTVRRCAL